jgi:outer membrane lipoprotein SlyB
MEKVMKSVATLIAAVLLAFPVAAQDIEIKEGVVEEITITVSTDEGSKTFVVDEDVDLDDVAVGTKIRFVPLQDKIEILEVMDDD